MDNSLTPKSICTDVANGKLNSSLASELLISLIEGSDDHLMRTESIKAYELVGIMGEKAFKIFENALLSDESQLVRSAAINIIIKFYLDKGMDSINWVIQHDTSPLLLKNLIGLLNNLDILPNTLKESISKIIDNYSNQLNLNPQETKFIIDLEALFARDQKKAILNVDFYKKYAKIKNLKGNREWIKIKKRAITILSFNYFHWKFLSDNPERVKSILKLKYPDIYLNSVKKFSENENSAIIPYSIGNLRHLKILDLSNNDLKELPKSIVSLKQLQSLDLSHNNFFTIPEEIFTLKTLKTLDLSNNHIQLIPDEIKNLKSLMNLTINENQIQSIPSSLSGFLNSLEVFKYL